MKASKTEDRFSTTKTGFPKTSNVPSKFCILKKSCHDTIHGFQFLSA